MISTGLLAVSNIKQFGKTLRTIEKSVGEKIYVHLNIPEEKCQPLPTWSHLISQLYMEHSQICHKSLQMNIIVSSLRPQGESKKIQQKPIDMLFFDSIATPPPELYQNIFQYFQIFSSHPTHLGNMSLLNDIGSYQNFKDDSRMFDTVVVGGTFDRIHVGHKIFLTQAVIRCCRRLVVGVTTSRMNKSKTLHELILPVESRIEEVREFLTGIDETLQYEVVPIDDPFGPTQTDPNMDMIVVSAETQKGGHKVNEIRVKNNLRPLEIYCIDLVEAKRESLGPKEKKPRPNLPNEPYIIGLTGGIASGKTFLSTRLLKKGAQVLDCDMIAHEIYEPDQVCYRKVVDHFGNNILSSDGRIDRQKLSEIVFDDPKALEILNNMVWPEILIEVKRRIHYLYDQHKCNVVIVEAAVLLKAGWDKECHEIWSTIVPPELAVQRIMKRNGLNEEQARKRLASQMDNYEVVSRSHIVFSSQWSDEFTQEQVEKAWAILMEDIQNRKAKHI